MSLSPGYVLEFGDVWLHAGAGRGHSRPVCREGEGLAVVYDRDCDLLYKHGHQSAVSVWFDKESRVNGSLLIFPFPAESRTVELLNMLMEGALRLADFVEALEDHLFGTAGAA